MKSCDVEWDAFRRAAMKRGATFAALTAEQVRAIEQAWTLPPALLGLLASSYPADPVPLASFRLCPSVTDLLEKRREDEKWPRDWFPLTTDLHHHVYFLKDGAVFSLFNDTDFDESGYIAPREPVYRSFASFLRAATGVLERLDQRSYEWSQPGLFNRLLGGRPLGRLSDSVVSAIKQGYGAETDGPALVPWLGTTIDERDRWWWSELPA